MLSLTQKRFLPSSFLLASILLPAVLKRYADDADDEWTCTIPCHGCSDNCICVEDDTGWLHVQCTERKITSISQVWLSLIPNKTEILSYKQNELRSIPTKGFDHEVLGGLYELVLANNKISHLHKEAFWGLEKLNYLDLSFNELKMIHAGVFVGCPIMAALNLSSNLITEIQDDSFEELKQLGRLDLSRNQLREISNTTLYGLKNLRSM
ncbi:uncharacterized protein LOC144641129 [Oculina patagonica]